MAQMLILLYKQPKDSQKFEAYYNGTHVPLAGKALGNLIAGVDIVKVVGGGVYYRVAIIRLPQGKTVDELMKTEGMKTTLADLKNFVAEGGVETLVCEADG